MRHPVLSQSYVETYILVNTIHEQDSCLDELLAIHEQDSCPDELLTNHHQYSTISPLIEIIQHPQLQKFTTTY